MFGLLIEEKVSPVANSTVLSKDHPHTKVAVEPCRPGKELLLPLRLIVPSNASVVLKTVEMFKPSIRLSERIINLLN